MTIDEAISHCLEVAEQNEQGLYDAIALGGQNPTQEEIANCEQCAADHRQLAEWLTELKQWRRVYGVCPSYEMCIPECKEGYNAQIAEYKRLLKAAVEDFRLIAEVKDCPAIDVSKYKWRYADEAQNLLNDEK